MSQHLRNEKFFAGRGCTRGNTIMEYVLSTALLALVLAGSIGALVNTFPGFVALSMNGKVHNDKIDIATMGPDFSTLDSEVAKKFVVPEGYVQICTDKTCYNILMDGDPRLVDTTGGNGQQLLKFLTMYGFMHELYQMDEKQSSTLLSQLISKLANEGQAVSADIASQSASVKYVQDLYKKILSTQQQIYSATAVDKDKLREELDQLRAEYSKAVEEASKDGTVDTQQFEFIKMLLDYALAQKNAQAIALGIDLNAIEEESNNITSTAMSVNYSAGGGYGYSTSGYTSYGMYSTSSSLATAATSTETSANNICEQANNASSQQMNCYSNNNNNGNGNGNESQNE